MKLRYPLILSILLLVFACDRAPFGYDQFERNIGDARFGTLVADRTSGRSYGKFSVNNEDQDLYSLFIGRNADYESRILILFPLADTLPKVDSTDSIMLTLKPRVKRPITFDIYPVVTEWTEEQTTWHDAQTAMPWLDEGSDYDASRLIATVTIGTDSMVTVPVSKAHAKYLINDAHGMVFISRPGTDSFASLYSRLETGRLPTITYYYGKSKSTFTPTENTFIVDTIGLNLAPAGMMWLGAGYVFRSYLRFSLDSLRDSLGNVPDSTTTIVSAALAVFPDTTRTFSLRETVQVAAHRLTGNYYPGEASAPYEEKAFGTANYIVHQDTIVNLDVRPIVQFWAEHPDSNFGLLLTLEPPNAGITRLELRRGSRLPQLRVGFVTPPEGRFR